MGPLVGVALAVFRVRTKHLASRQPLAEARYGSLGFTQILEEDLNLVLHTTIKRRQVVNRVATEVFRRSG
ncbi:hypothetical protein PC117_g6192 [Phytophthora cactorum]|uniref:Uncharacterized protein n=1 Tax=Phytophthora cactorum TaxID=29920 RepID=A0A8T1E425_9STRA|nr:hypothetical protein PC117_g6192 [Phytophthora cactorum]KAG3029576.1 hypothetical protein PC120_g4261 [Phytophthora cactorum]